MTGWRLDRLTGGQPDRACSHSYYDVPAFDGAGRRILAHRTTFAERQPGPEDVVVIGLLDADRPDAWEPLGTSRAWSWQQGPLAQWIGGGPWLTWSDREDGRFVARLLHADSGERRVLDAPLYAADSGGRFGLSLNMARIDALRPGYGFPGGEGAMLDDRRPNGDGVWRVDLRTGERRLIVSLGEAAAFLFAVGGPIRRLRHALGRFTYWFNHAKISPDGRRFTVKLRWRRPGGPWGDHMGVSLTGSTDGGDLRLLADATSHVIWLNDRQLYFWRKGKVALYEDAAPRGRRVRLVAPEILTENVHLRHLPPGPAGTLGGYVYDTPYRETVDLMLMAPGAAAPVRLARFDGHAPPKGPFRCDLHPCPSADGRRIVVTSLQGGRRGVYVLTREDG